MHLASTLPGRVRSLAPEAVAFGVIGAANTALYMIIVNVTLTVGAVKANVIATLITTALSYLANRYWTYRGREKRSKRREGTLFFGFNLVGMIIQSGTVGFVKYGFDLDEGKHRIIFNLATFAGIGIATVFRFWAYRTLVFRPHPTDHAAPTGTAEALAEAIETEELAHQAVEAEIDEFAKFTGMLDADMIDADGLNGDRLNAELEGAAPRQPDRATRSAGAEPARRAG